MYWDVVDIEPLEDYRIHVRLESGREGVFDLKPYLEHGVFQELKDPAYFRRASIVLGVVTWPNGQDIAPDTWYAEVTAEPLPD